MLRPASCTRGSVKKTEINIRSFESDGGVDGAQDAYKGQCENFPNNGRPKNRESPTLLLRFVHAMTPRIWTATPLDLAIARIMITCITLDAVPWSVEHAQEQLSYNVDHEGRNMTFTYPVCGGVLNSFKWWPIKIASYATGEFLMLRIALWLSMLGLATQLSMAAAGILVIRYKVITLGLQLSTGHWNDFMGPVILMLAFSPCADVMSIDAVITWAWQRGPYFTSDAYRLASSPQRVGMSALWLLKRHVFEQPDALHGICLMVVAIYIGVYILAAGLAKAGSGQYWLFSWAFSDHVKAKLYLYWVRQGGEAYMPSLFSSGWNPIRMITNSYLFPILRVDKIPMLLHFGCEVVMIWECLHWYLLLCAPAVRCVSIFCDVMFHMSVAVMMGIYWFYHLLVAHLMFLPWSHLLSKACSALVGSSCQTNHDSVETESLWPVNDMHAAESSSQIGSRIRRHPLWFTGPPRLVLVLAIAAIFIGGQVVELLPRSQTFIWMGRPVIDVHCHPFDPAPGFGFKHAADVALWRNAGTDVPVVDGTLLRTAALQIHFLRLDGKVSSMFMWEAICHMERKEHCATWQPGPLHNKVAYNKVCCLMAAPHDPSGHFRNQLVMRFTQEKGGALTQKEYVDMWKMLSIHDYVVPNSNNATQSIAAVVFSRPFRLLASPDVGWNSTISAPLHNKLDEKCECFIPVQPGSFLDAVRSKMPEDRFANMLVNCDIHLNTTIPSVTENDSTQDLMTSA